MIRLILLLSLAMSAAPAPKVRLCATMRGLIQEKEAPLVMGNFVLAPRASLRRIVHFQLCTPDSRPLRRRVHLEVVVEPQTPGIAPGRLVSRAVTTDTDGRFSGVYGFYSREPNAVWPEGFTSVELHHFLLDGETIATFVLEREAHDVHFHRRDETGGAGADGMTRATQ